MKRILFLVMALFAGLAQAFQTDYIYAGHNLHATDGYYATMDQPFYDWALGIPSPPESTEYLYFNGSTANTGPKVYSDSVTITGKTMMSFYLINALKDGFDPKAVPPAVTASVTMADGSVITSTPIDLNNEFNDWVKVQFVINPAGSEVIDVSLNLINSEDNGYGNDLGMTYPTYATLEPDPVVPDGTTQPEEEPEMPSIERLELDTSLTGGGGAFAPMLLALLLLLPFSANAQGWFAGVGVGKSQLDPSVTPSYLEGAQYPSAAGFLAGYDFGLLSIEGGYTHAGKYTKDFGEAGTAEALYRIPFVDVAMDLPLGFYGKLGLALLDAEPTGSNQIFKDQIHHSQVRGGLGWQVRGDVLGFRSEVVSTDKDVNTWMNYLVFHFDKPVAAIVEPTPPTKEEAIEIVNEYVVESIGFQYDSAILTADAMGELDYIADLVLTHDLHIRIMGHTSTEGSAEYNQHLSMGRAVSALLYLESRGVPGTNMTAIGYGESNPKVSPDDHELARMVNRRVEFSVDAL